MALCVCGEEFDDRRKALGYHTCLECGDGDATKEIIRKQASVVPQGHKQGLCYVADVRRQVVGTQKQDGIRWLA